MFCNIVSFCCKMKWISYCFVQLLSRVWLFVTPWTTALQVSLSFTISWGICSDSYPLSWWCYLTISSSAALFYCLWSFPAWGSFPVIWLFTSGGQSIGASAAVLQRNIQCWFPWGLTGLISLRSKGFSRVFSSTTIQRHQFFSAQPSLWSSSHVCTCLLDVFAEVSIMIRLKRIVCWGCRWIKSLELEKEKWNELLVNSGRIDSSSV